MRARNRGSITRRAGTRIMAGATPTRTSVKANVLAVAATARSAAAMSPSPPARACPLTRAMTGTGLSTMHVRMSGIRFGAAPPRSARSAPEQNTVPAPVSTMARTSSSPVASRNARSSSSSNCADKALRLCGESSVSVRTPSLWCTPTNGSVTWRSVGGVAREDEKGPVVSCAGGRDRRAPAVPKDAAGPLRTGDRAARRRVGGGPDLSGARALPQAGCRGALRARVRRGLRRHGGRPHLHPGRRRRRWAASAAVASRWPSPSRCRCRRLRWPATARPS